MKRTLLAIALLLTTAPALAQEPARTLDEKTTRSLVARYKSAKKWGLRAIVLSALGKRWHPAGAGIVNDALSAKDRRLRAFALEALRRCDDKRLKQVASQPIIEWLVTQGLADRNRFFRSRVQQLLARIAPFVDAQDARSIKAWWKQVGAAYKPDRPPIVKPPAASKKDPQRGSVAVNYRTQQLKYVTRAVALSTLGLDVVLCIDSTGSMQATINATRAAIAQIITIMQGISPTFRLGLVHYKAEAVFKGGAQMLSKLTGRVDEVGRALGRLRASGGGERPESVEKGLLVSLDKSMGWRRDSIKAVILIGDAPCYQSKLAELLNMAGQAHRGPWKGWADTRTPFVISTICAGSAQDTARVFKEIARRGGGAYQRVSARSRANAAIVKHLLAVSFGPQWRGQLDLFFEIYQTYRKQGAFR